MKKIYFLFFLFLQLQNYASAQTYSRALNVPVTYNGVTLENPWAGGINFPVFSECDFNNDGIKDLFVFERSQNRVLTFINNGTSGTVSYTYDPQYADQFPRLTGWAFLYDYNCDSKPDIFTVNSRNNGIAVYRNDTQGGALQFTLADTAVRADYGTVVSNIIASSFLVPHFNDIDNDGDMDILGQQFQCVGSFAYYRNRSMEDFGHCDSLKFELDSYAWGKFGLRLGNFGTVSVGNFNISCSEMMPVWNPSDIARRDDTYASIFAMDIDGDNDMDAVVGDSQTNNSLLVVNGGNNQMALMVSQDSMFPSYDVPINLPSFVAHAYIDVDNDGNKDFLASQSEFRNNHGVLYYRNQSSTATPQFSYQYDDFLQRGIVDAGEGAVPVFFDFDADGLTDIVIGTRKWTTAAGGSEAGLTVFRNIGTASAPAFEFVTDDFAGLKSMNFAGPLFPAFGDMDDDGDEDLILGVEGGELHYYLNTAGAGSPAVFVQQAINFMSIDVGQFSTPQIVDMNRDGKNDLVVGEKNGVLNYFENIGTASSPFFNSVPTIDTFGGIVQQIPPFVDGFTVPFVYEQGGAYRMLVADMDGKILVYSDIENNLGGQFTLTDTLFEKIHGHKIGFNLSVSGGDINNDSLTDLLIGFYGGGVQLYIQDDPTASVNETSFDRFLHVYPNPASGKIVINGTETTFLSAELYDINGRLIHTCELLNGIGTINTQELSEGVYVLSVRHEHGVLTRKIIIQHFE